MTDRTRDVVHEALEKLLDRERNALLAGDLETIAGLAEEKERLIGQLSGSAVPGLEGLRNKAARNQALLNSALEGIRAVADRLEAVRQLRGTLDTYDSNGRRHSIDGLRQPRVEKRA